MDCSVTGKWTKPSDRFLKPTFDESNFPPMPNWHLEWRSLQYRFDSDAALWSLELDSGRRHWRCLFRSFAAHTPSVCGQSDGRRFARCSSVGSYQCNLCPSAFRPDAGVERGTDASAFPCFGRLGGV